MLTITLDGGREALRALLRMLTSLLDEHKEQCMLLVARRRVCSEGSALHTRTVLG
jgi:hypothetical protein